MIWKAIAIVEAALLVILFIVFLSNSLSQRKIMKKAGLIVKGKLNVEDIRVRGKKSNSKIIASAFNSIKNNLLTFIEETKGNVITLSDATETLTKSVIANQAGNEQIAEGVTTVVGKVAEQLDLVKNNLDIIRSNNEKMQEMDQATTNIKGLLDNNVVACNDGLGGLEKYEQDIDIVAVELGKSRQLLEKFNNDIKNIKVVGDLIISINNQLRMMAINASIEAARAGQVGRGFEVVAQEMKEMSDKTKEGMGKITRVVDEIIDSSNQVNGSILACEDTFNKSKETFNGVSNSFKTINQQSFEIHDGIKDISERINDIAHGFDESKEQASQLYDASQLINSSTHEMAAASEETAAESTHISKNVENLGGMLVGIQGLLKQFNTAVVPVEEMASRSYRIAFLSMLDNDFWYGVRRGVFYAMKELSATGAIVDYYPFFTTGEERDREVREQISQCVEQGVDGIILPGFLDQGNDYLKRAVSRGTKVFAFNCDCAPDIGREGCFSPNSLEAGALAAASLEKTLGRRGKVVVMTGDLSNGVNNDRKRSFLKKISHCRGIRVVEDIIVEDDANDVYERTTDILRMRSDISAFYITTGMAISVAKAIEDAGLTGQVIVVGFDHTPEIFDFIKKGIIAAAIGQDPFGQGHDPIVWMYNNLVTGTNLPNEFMSCRLSVVDSKNVENLI